MMGTRRTWQPGLALGAYLAGGCSHPVCENTVISGTPSPDGAVIAFVFTRHCGAARISTHVSVVDFHGTLRNDTGNVLAVGTEQPVHVSWRDPKTLIVTGFEKPVYQHARQIHAVMVEFR